MGSSSEGDESSSYKLDGLNRGVLLDGPADRAKAEKTNNKRTKRHRNAQLWFNGILMAATIVTAGIVVRQNQIVIDTFEPARHSIKQGQPSLTACPLKVPGIFLSE